MSSEEIQGFIIFIDLKGFSKLDDESHKEYIKVLTMLNRLLESYKIQKDTLEDEQTAEQSLISSNSRARVWNTWGDAIMAVFDRGIDAANFMLTYREFFQKYKILNLEPRIAGHFGTMNIIKDAMLNDKYNVFGHHVNLTARIEPITFPGEIYVSDDFKQAFKLEEKDVQQHRCDNRPIKYNQIEFQDLKEWTLPKNFSTQKIHLYRMYHTKELAWNITALFAEQRNTTLESLNQIITIESDIRLELNSLREKINMLNSLEQYKAYLEEVECTTPIEQFNGAKYFAMATLWQEVGEFAKAINYIELCKKQQVQTTLLDKESQVETEPFKFNSKVLKLEAVCHSRLGNFDIAKKILYEILQSNPKDSDALCKLAAQMKREAFVIVEKNQEDAFELLKHALNLYLEAFRLTGDYYPAINAAYIKRLLGEHQSWHLANYIFENWKEQTGEDWWIDSTLAESLILLNDFESAKARFERAMQIRHVNVAELEATRVQIVNYIECLQLFNGMDANSKEISSLVEIEKLLAVGELNDHAE